MKKALIVLSVLLVSGSVFANKLGDVFGKLIDGDEGEWVCHYDPPINTFGRRSYYEGKGKTLAVARSKAASACSGHVDFWSKSDANVCRRLKNNEDYMVCEQEGTDSGLGDLIGDAIDKKFGDW